MALTVRTGSVKRRLDGLESVELLVEDETRTIVHRPVYTLEPDPTGIVVKNAGLRAIAEAARLLGRKATALTPSGMVIDTSVAPRQAADEGAIEFSRLELIRQRWQHAVLAGFVAADDPRVIAASDAARAAFRPEYLGLDPK